MGKNTTFIIGAGASSEVNLPTGDALKKSIAALLDMKWENGYEQSHGDHAIARALEHHVQVSDDRFLDVNSFVSEAWRIRDALPLAISIDNLIEQHKDNEKLTLCGKLGIARAIVEAEHDSLLYIDPREHDSKLDLTKIEDTWYAKFFKLLTENCMFDDLPSRFESTSLIIFNYDRCVEHFLFHALQIVYGVSDDKAIEVLNCMEIFHPYGTVGSLPWQKGHVQTGFGDKPGRLLELAGLIKTYTEGTSSKSSDIVRIRQRMRSATRIVYLGFAFHEQNMKLIKPAEGSMPATGLVECFATTQGFSGSDVGVIESQIANQIQHIRPVNTLNKSCSDFFDYFWKTLSQ